MRHAQVMASQSDSQPARLFGFSGAVARVVPSGDVRNLARNSASSSCQRDLHLRGKELSATGEIAAISGKAPRRLPLAHRLRSALDTMFPSDYLEASQGCMFT